MSVMGMTIYDLLRRAASLHATSNAVVHDGGTLTYPELLGRVDQLANGFAHLGLAHGARVCVLAQNHLEYFELYFACAKLGLIVYPINWRLSATEIGHVLTRAEPDVMVFDQSMAALTAEVRESAQAAAVKNWYCIDGAADGAEAISGLYVAGDSAQTSTSADDIAVVISTAAVDVIPRGAALTSANIAANNVQNMLSMGLKDDECHLLCLPMFHITALGFAWTMVHCGGCNVITAKFDPQAAVQLVDEHNVTLLGSFPPLLSTLLDQAQEAGSKLASLRHVAGLETPDTAQRLQHETSATFWIGFGQSETSGFVSVQPYFERTGAAGKPAALSQIELRDDDGQAIPVGAVGEIVVRGPVVMHSYFGQLDVTAHTFRDGWHHTGDLGRFDEDGYLFYAGRKPEKELIKPGGENVYPQEVESVIDEMEGVTGVCVFGVADAKWGEAVKAVIEADASAVSAEQVREFVGSKIGRFKRPSQIEFVTAIARAEDGLVDRDAVKTEFGDQS
jgi:acyl-CoA synthetase (AMP-forming)/AMP-acid ligase II